MKMDALAMLPFLFCSTFGCLHADEAEFRLLDEEPIQGALISLDAENLRIKTKDKEIGRAIEQVLKIVFGNRQAPSASLYTLELTDGSILQAKQISFDSKKASVRMSGGHSIEMKPSSLKLLYKSGLSADQIKAIRNSAAQMDTAFIAKKDILDSLDGAAHSFDGNNLQFEWDNETLPISKDRLAGILFYRPRAQRGTPKCLIEDVLGNSIWAKSVQLIGSQLKAESALGFTTALELKLVKVLDYSLGKVVFLSDLQPASVRETPFFDIVWHYTVDKNLRGDPLRLDGKQYKRGLSLHSRCRLTYSIAGKYKRFVADVGIDDSVGQLGHVLCQVIGDGKTLFQSEIEGGRPPKKLDLEVKGVRTLVLFVDFGQRLDIGDRLNFADAKLVR